MSDALCGAAAKFPKLSKLSRTPSLKQVPSWHIQSCNPAMTFMHICLFQDHPFAGIGAGEAPESVPHEPTRPAQGQPVKF